MKPVVPRRPTRKSVRPDHVLTENDIVVFGLEEAPDDAGLSWDEIMERRQGHGEG